MSSTRFWAWLLLVSVAVTQSACSVLFKDVQNHPTLETLDQRFASYSFPQRVHYFKQVLNGVHEALPENANAHRILFESLYRHLDSVLMDLEKSPILTTTARTWVPLNENGRLYTQLAQIKGAYQVYKEHVSSLNREDSLNDLPLVAAQRLAVLDDVILALYREMQAYPVLFPSSEAQKVVHSYRALYALQYKNQLVAALETDKKDTRAFFKMLEEYFSGEFSAAKSQSILRSRSFGQTRKMVFSLTPKDSSDIQGFEDALDPIVRAQVSFMMLEKYLKDEVPFARNPATDENTDEFIEEELPAQQQVVTRMPTKTYPNIVLVGLVPGQYLNKNRSQYYLGVVEVQNRVIRVVREIQLSQIPALKAASQGKLFIELTNNFSTSRTERDFDVIYPGLINLHNHTKQNVLPVWSEARGQFENRFEWRAWNIYKLAVSKNMNPWIGFGNAIACASFRWSEIQGIIGGVTYQQGFSTAEATPCVDGFGVHRVEDANAFLLRNDAVRAPTDLMSPDDFTYVWQVLRPLIRAIPNHQDPRSRAYERVLAGEINKNCPGIGITEQNVGETEGLRILANKKLLTEKCTGTLHPKFIRYINWAHPVVASAKRSLSSPKRSAYIVHLAEGRRNDIYNRAEFEIIKLLGLVMPQLTFVHGVGLDPEDFQLMGRNQMGLVWSPFSNLLLYNQTLNLAEAFRNRIPVALGTDWVPTGTKNLLEELKVAKAYVLEDPEREGLARIITNEELYKMVTENPARLIGQWVPRGGIGKIEVGAMGSLIVTSRLDDNPYTNLVERVTERDVNLVLSDGDVVYGNQSYVQQAGITAFEVLGSEVTNTDLIHRDNTIPVLAASGANSATKLAHLQGLGSLASRYNFSYVDNCRFLQPKVLVHQNTLSFRPHLQSFLQTTSLNLDRLSDIQKLLAIVVPTQGENRNDGVASNDRFALNRLPSLYTCNDVSHSTRFSTMMAVTPTNRTFEFTANRNNRDRLRTELRLGRRISELNVIYAE